MRTKLDSEGAMAIVPGRGIRAEEKGEKCLTFRTVRDNMVAALNPPKEFDTMISDFDLGAYSACYATATGAVLAYVTVQQVSISPPARFGASGGIFLGGLSR